MTLFLLSILLKDSLLFMPSRTSFYITLINKNETYSMPLKERVMAELVWKGFYTLITERDILVINRTGTSFYARTHLEKYIQGAFTMGNALYIVTKDEIRIMGLSRRIYVIGSISIPPGVYLVSNRRIIKMGNPTEVYLLKNKKLKKEFSVNISFVDCVYYKNTLYGVKKSMLYIINKDGKKRHVKLKGIKSIKDTDTGPVVEMENSVYIVTKKKSIFTGRRRIIGWNFISWTDGKKSYFYRDGKVETVEAKDPVIVAYNKILVFDGKKIYRYDRREPLLSFQIGSFTREGFQFFKRYSEFMPLIYKMEDSLIKVRVGYFKEKYPLLKKIWKDGWFVYAEEHPLEIPQKVDINKDGIKEIPLWNENIITLWALKEDNYLYPVWEDTTLHSISIEDMQDSGIIIKSLEGWFILKFKDSTYVLEPLED